VNKCDTIAVIFGIDICHKFSVSKIVDIGTYFDSTETVQVTLLRRTLVSSP